MRGAGGGRGPPPTTSDYSAFYCIQNHIKFPSSRSEFSEWEHAQYMAPQRANEGHAHCMAPPKHINIAPSQVAYATREGLSRFGRGYPPNRLFIESLHWEHAQCVAPSPAPKSKSAARPLHGAPRAHQHRIPPGGVRHPRGLGVLGWRLPPETIETEGHKPLRRRRGFESRPARPARCPRVLQSAHLLVVSVLHLDGSNARRRRNSLQVSLTPAYSTRRKG